MRWIIFIVFFLLIEIYAYQALKTLTRNYWVIILYFVITAAVLGNFLYQWLSPVEGSVLTGARGYAFGFLLSVLLFKLILTLIMFGEDIYRMGIAGYEKLSSSKGNFALPSR